MNIFSALTCIDFIENIHKYKRLEALFNDVHDLILYAISCNALGFNWNYGIH